MSDKRARTHLHCTVNGKERDNFVADNMLLADSNDMDDYFNRIRVSIEKTYNKYQLKSFGIQP